MTCHFVPRYSDRCELRSHPQSAHRSARLHHCGDYFARSHFVAQLRFHVDYKCAAIARLIISRRLIVLRVVLSIALRGFGFVLIDGGTASRRFGRFHARCHEVAL